MPSAAAGKAGVEGGIAHAAVDREVGADYGLVRFPQINQPRRIAFFMRSSNLMRESI